MKLIEKHTCHGGQQEVWSHDSKSLNCRMNFAVYLPPQIKDRQVPVLYWLSGLTCTEQNFITKSGMQSYAAKHGIMVVVPDTSPRGTNVPDSESYDLGQGAGFYINAIKSPWDKHYKMYDYIVKELPEIIIKNFPATEKKSISGHSMGGHGALTIALKNPDEYVSVSAFSPIVSPSQIPWGEKAFSAYLGEDRELWEKHDAVELILQGRRISELLIDQGLADPFYKVQLRTKNLEKACHEMNIDALIRYHEGYDHSYYFISTFIGQHLSYHADRLSQAI